MENYDNYINLFQFSPFLVIIVALESAGSAELSEGQDFEKTR